MTDQEHRERFAEILKSWMEENALTKDDAAKMLDTTDVVIGGLLASETSAGYEHIELLAENMGTTTEDLIVQIRGVNLPSLMENVSNQD